MTSLVIQVDSSELGRLGQALAYCGLAGEFVLQPSGEAIVTLREADAIRAILLLLERGFQLGVGEAAFSELYTPRPLPVRGH